MNDCMSVVWPLTQTSWCHFAHGASSGRRVVTKLSCVNEWCTSRVQDDQEKFEHGKARAQPFDEIETQPWQRLVTWTKAFLLDRHQLETVLNCPLLGIAVTVKKAPNVLMQLFQ